MHRGAALVLALGLAPSAAVAHAVEIPAVAGETLTLDLSNTTELGYHFDNRNTPEGEGRAALRPENRVDDGYGEWTNRLYLQAWWWRLQAGLRLDSAVYFGVLGRAEAQEIIVQEIGGPDLDLENSFGRELHSRYNDVLYPAKLWIGYSQPHLELVVGDFYAQMGRGLVLSVRKIDELGVDTTVRGTKLVLDDDAGPVKAKATLLGGQMNPVRLDLPTGRILHGAGSPLFFGFPVARDFAYYAGAKDAVASVDPARPSYLEDTVLGATIEAGTRYGVLGANGLVLLRSAQSAAQLACIGAGGAAARQQCALGHPSFDLQEPSRAHDLVHNFSGWLRIPQLARTLDGYVEVAGQQLLEGRVLGVDAAGGPIRRVDPSTGYAVYANVNFVRGPLSASLEGKQYRSFFPLGANIDNASKGFGAPEFSAVAYSQPPTAESIWVEPLGSPDVCNTGGRGRVDFRLTEHAKIYGWVGRYASWTEIDPTNAACASARPELGQRPDALRTDSWDLSVGGELDSERRRSHAWAWVGTRLVDRAVAAPASAELSESSSAFYREGYVRYDLGLHLTGPLSLSSLGFHRRRYEPGLAPEPWHEGENYLSLNWAPNFAFIFGYEYQTRPGAEPHYLSGAVEVRSKRSDVWWGQLLDTARLFVGQRRAALRCVGGTCRLFPAFEGARVELVSRF
ncbi:MAG: hypothetical protein HY744_33995 [Deltaproteobacteria bacterium]|nr:hypothetical protein [Deltaproteobacteria bacterium]